jgi:probable F420-dependent oxidoreductase
LRDLVVAAEDLGVHGVVLTEHTSVPATITSIYPYGGGGPGRLPAEAQFADPLVAIAGLAASTTRLRFSTGVLLSVLRHPILLARAAATAAGFADGRLDLGIGVGWMREEFDALNIPFDGRGSRFEESIGLLRRLWTGEAVEHRGHHYGFEPLVVRPIPPAPIRLLVGGHSDLAIRRAARFGDGWMAAYPAMDELRFMLTKLDTERKDAGTSEQPFELRSGLATIDRDGVRTLGELGVHGLVVRSWQLVSSPAPRADMPVHALIDGLSAMLQEIGDL